MDGSHASDLVGQWLITAPGPEQDQLIVSLDPAPPDRKIIYGVASYAWFPHGVAPGGEVYEVAVSVIDHKLRAEARLLVTYNGNFQSSPAGNELIVRAEIERVGSSNLSLTLTSGPRQGRVFRLERLDLHSPPRLDGELLSWDEYCAWAHRQARVNEASDLMIYRGHKRSTYPLRSSFHRTGRSDLRRYLFNARELSHRISAVTGRRFDLHTFEQQLELFGVAQHHGYPSPFLDWTTSPFIAAYFAFASNARRKNEHDQDVRVRVIQCNAGRIQPRPPITDLLDPRPAVMTARVEATQNLRIVPQQSVFTFTNIVDIEQMLLQVSAAQGRQLLTAIDLRLDERDTALSDLRAMGITEGSMFPGIDGTCRDLGQLHFGVLDE